MTVAILGGTGLTGRFCLEQLLGTSKISKVVAIGRHKTGLTHEKLEEVMLIDNQMSQSVHADAFISCVGTTIKKAGSEEAFKNVDFDLPVSIAKKLKQNGCQSAAIISAMGADEKSLFFYNRTKGNLEIAMERLEFRSLTILRPSFIEGPREEKRTGEAIALSVFKILNPLLIGPFRHYRKVQADEIGAALTKAVVAQKPGNTIYKSGDIKRLADLLV